MARPNHIGISTEKSLPDVEAATIEAFMEEGADVLDLYRHNFGHEEELTLFVRRRAQQLAPDDLDRREAIVTVALETIGIMRRQADTESLQHWFDAETAPEPEIKKPSIELPPAA